MQLNPLSSIYQFSTVYSANVNVYISVGSGKKWGITWYRLVYQPEAASVMELKGLSL